MSSASQVPAGRPGGMWGAGFERAAGAAQPSSATPRGARSSYSPGRVSRPHATSAARTGRQGCVSRPDATSAGRTPTQAALLHQTRLPQPVHPPWLRFSTRRDFRSPYRSPRLRFSTKRDFRSPYRSPRLRFSTRRDFRDRTHTRCGDLDLGVDGPGGLLVSCASARHSGHWSLCRHRKVNSCPSHPARQPARRYLRNRSRSRSRRERCHRSIISWFRRRWQQ